MLQTIWINQLMCICQNRCELFIKIEYHKSSLYHRILFQRAKCFLQRRQLLNWQNILNLEIDFSIYLGIEKIMLKPRQPYTHRAQHIQLTMCPPKLIPRQSGGEMSKVMPEPID